jgi:hypothetical protein
MMVSVSPPMNPFIPALCPLPWINIVQPGYTACVHYSSFLLLPPTSALGPPYRWVCAPQVASSLLAVCPAPMFMYHNVREKCCRGGGGCCARNAGGVERSRRSLLFLLLREALRGCGCLLSPSCIVRVNVLSCFLYLL